MFILIMNWSGLLPGVGSVGFEEAKGSSHEFVPLLRPANTDLNTTLALAIISFCAWIYFVWKYAGPKHFLMDTFGNKANPAEVAKPIYIALFAVVTVHVRLCFAIEYRTSLFCCSLAYAVQNLTYKLFLIFWGIGESFRLYDGWGNMFELYYRLIYYAFFAAIAVATYFLFIGPLTRRMENSRINYRMLIISVVVLAVTILLCSVEDIYFSRLSTQREGRFDDYNYYVLWQTGNIFSVVCCAIVILLISKTIGRSNIFSMP